MAIELIKPNFAPNKRVNTLSFANKLFDLVQKDKSKEAKDVRGHWSPRLHLNPIKINQSYGEIDDLTDCDEFEFTQRRGSDEFNIKSELTNFENSKRDQTIFDLKSIYSLKDVDRSSMNETIDETIYEDSSTINHIKSKSQIIQNLSTGLSVLSISKSHSYTNQIRIKSWIKKDSTDWMISSSKRVQFKIINGKGEQKIFDTLDDSESESDFEDSISYYRACKYY